MKIKLLKPMKKKINIASSQQQPQDTNYANNCATLRLVFLIISLLTFQLTKLGILKSNEFIPYTVKDFGKGGIDFDLEFSFFFPLPFFHTIFVMRSLSYKNQSIMDWFLYDRDLLDWILHNLCLKYERYSLLQCTVLTQ